MNENALPLQTSVRLPTELRNALTRAASANTRTLSSEIVKRLTDSVREDLPGSLTVPAVAANGETHTAQEARLLKLFRRMDPERQLALLTLLKD